MKVGLIASCLRPLLAGGKQVMPLCRALDITVDELIRANPGVDPLNLQIGQYCVCRKIYPCPSGVYWRYLLEIPYSMAAVGTTGNFAGIKPGGDHFNLQVRQKICLP